MSLSRLNVYVPFGIPGIAELDDFGGEVTTHERRGHDKREAYDTNAKYASPGKMTTPSKANPSPGKKKREDGWKEVVRK